MAKELWLVEASKNGKSWKNILDIRPYREDEQGEALTMASYLVETGRYAVVWLYLFDAGGIDEVIAEVTRRTVDKELRHG